MYVEPIYIYFAPLHVKQVPSPSQILKGRCVFHGVHIYRPGNTPRVVYVLPSVENSRILILTTVSSCFPFFHLGSRPGIPLFPYCFGFSGMLFKWNDIAA